MSEGLFTLLIWVGLLYFIWKLFVIVGGMAERRGQHRQLWRVAALFLNPLGAMILLWLFVSVSDRRY